METFDEAYAKYLRTLEKLDGTEDIAEKNLLFRQLTYLLSDLEHRLNNHQPARDRELCEDQEPTHWN